MFSQNKTWTKVKACGKFMFIVCKTCIEGVTSLREIMTDRPTGQPTYQLIDIHEGIYTSNKEIGKECGREGEVHLDNIKEKKNM